MQQQPASGRRESRIHLVRAPGRAGFGQVTPGEDSHERSRSRRRGAASRQRRGPRPAHLHAEPAARGRRAPHRESRRVRRRALGRRRPHVSPGDRGLAGALRRAALVERARGRLPAPPVSRTASTKSCSPRPRAPCATPRASRSVRRSSRSRRSGDRRPGSRSRRSTWPSTATALRRRHEDHALGEALHAGHGRHGSIPCATGGPGRRWWRSARRVGRVRGCRRARAPPPRIVIRDPGTIEYTVSKCLLMLPGSRSASGCRTERRAPGVGPDGLGPARLASGRILVPR